MNWRHTLIIAAIVVPVVALLAFGLTRNPRDLASPLPGSEAPDFSLAVMDRTGTDDGTPADSVRLASLRGDVAVVNFWASWCLACRDEHEALSNVAEAYRDRGVHFYGVLYNDSPDNARRWIERMGGQSYPTLLDPGARTAIAFGLYGVPETFFIDRSGRVVDKHVGPVTTSILTQTIDSLLAMPEAP